MDRGIFFLIVFVLCLVVASILSLAAKNEKQAHLLIGIAAIAIVVVAMIATPLVISPLVGQ